MSVSTIEVTDFAAARLLTARGASRIDAPSVSNLHKSMGQQSNKIEKRRSRLAYIERKKVKANEAAVLRAPKKKAAPKKKEAAPVAEAAAE